MLLRETYSIKKNPTSPHPLSILRLYDKGGQVLPTVCVAVGKIAVRCALDKIVCEIFTGYNIVIIKY